MGSEQISAQIFIGDNAQVSQPVSWLDDIALLVETERPDMLGPSTGRAAAITQQCLLLVGISTNFAEGKTDAVLAFNGKGSLRARQQILLDQGAEILLPCPCNQELRMRCTDAYVHLSTTRTPKAQAQADIHRRAGIARALYRPLRSRLLRNECLSPAERVRLLTSTVLASFLHGIDSWSMATEGEFQLYRKHFMGFLSRGSTPHSRFPMQAPD